MTGSRPTIYRRCRLLKKWLIRHGDTPYPTGLDKRLLAQRCNMTVTQVTLYAYVIKSSSYLEWVYKVKHARFPIVEARCSAARWFSPPTVSLPSSLICALEIL